MNVVFISPHFPDYFYLFCNGLKERDINVLGIGDCPYDELPQHTKDSLTEYFKVDDLEDYEQCFRAVGYFTWHYGKIDWIESQNEYWLELEATLRRDFNVTTGTKIEHLAPMKYKSKMKEVYQEAGILTARFIIVDSLKTMLDFARKVDYPLIVKPDNGVGASFTYKLSNEEDVRKFYKTKPKNITFILEEMIPGHVETFDGITDRDKNILFVSSHVMLNSIMDNVNESSDTAFHSQPIIGTDLYRAGQKVVEAFDTRSRFFHFEFFRLDKDKKGLGKKGELVGLEINMRTPGAYIPDMIDFEYHIDIYTMWADMLKYNKVFVDYEYKRWVAYIGRRHAIQYVLSHDEVIAKFKNQIIVDRKVPSLLAEAMGDYVYIVEAKSQAELNKIIKALLERKTKDGWLRID